MRRERMLGEAAMRLEATPDDCVYRFRDLCCADLLTMQRWLAEPHLRRWWGEPDMALAEIREAIDAASTRAMIVELDGMPLAYFQEYDPHIEEDHPYRDQPKGTLGVDISIGPPEFLGRGHGAAMLRQRAAELFDSGVPRLVIDPDPSNVRAVRAYEKARFVAFDRRNTQYGLVLMMARDAHDMRTA